MLHLFKGKGKEALQLMAPAAGKLIPVTEVPDPTFSEELVGKGIAIIPSDGKFYAPADGSIDMVFDTLHALTMTTVDGAEILLHIGLETVTLKGEPFQAHVAAGDTVKKGDLLIEADLSAIEAAGLKIVSPMVICNPDAFTEIKAADKDTVTKNDVALTFEKA